MPINRIANSLLDSSRQTKTGLLLALDVVLILLSIWLAFFLRLDTFELPEMRILIVCLVAPIIAIPIFIRNGLYRAVIRYLASDVIWTVLRAVSFYCALWALVVLFSNIPGMSRAVLLINWVLCLIFIGGSRFIAQWLTNVYLTTWAGSGSSGDRNRVFIYGAGEAGVQIASGLASHRETEVIGFIDDSPRLQNQFIKGLKVYGPNDLPSLVTQSKVSEILLAMPSVSRGRRTEILSELEPLPVLVRTLPDIASIATGKVKVQDIRELDIADLLGRETVPPDEKLMRKNIDGRVVMVTGAGGSIGAELCRQIAMLNPKTLILLEQSEFNLYSIDRELSKRKMSFETVLGSVNDQKHMTDLCIKHKVETIFHAAAYKHVPLVESNVEMGVKNNVFGTCAAAQAAIAANVDCFVLISTDKAVRPTNIMGASKRFSELVLQSLNDHQTESKTRFIMVRFGNVIGSSGSVIPLFRDQLKLGGPITVTDAEVTRYFMTIPEASQLVIQAGAMGNGGEVFVLDMGSPVKIYDLALKMIRLSGLKLKDADNPQGDIEIEFSGLRPGEKLYEELLIGDNVSTTQHSRIMMANEKFLSWQEVGQKLALLQLQIDDSDAQGIRETMASVVEGYVA